MAFSRSVFTTMNHGIGVVALVLPELGDALRPEHVVVIKSGLKNDDDVAEGMVRPSAGHLSVHRRSASSSF